MSASFIVRARSRAVAILKVGFAMQLERAWYFVSGITHRATQTFKRSLRCIRKGSAKPKQTRLCIFAHFDENDRVASYVLELLKGIRAADADILFVSTAPVSKKTLTPVLPYVRYALTRENVGYDFGSYAMGVRYALEKNMLDEYNEIMLVNDSVYGPFYPLKPICDRMSKKGFDLWGISDTIEITWHLQSYFLVFSRRFFVETMKDFFLNYRVYPSKMLLISRYEIGTTKRAQKHGANIGAYTACEDAFADYEKKTGRSPYERTRAGRIGNPVLLLWDFYITNKRFPFLKTALLKTKRCDTLRFNDWRTVVKKTGYPIARIEESGARYADTSAVSL